MNIEPKSDERDLACSREPIHIPGAIQPHGALFVLESDSLACIQISVNAEEFCGLRHILGRSIRDLIPMENEEFFALLRSDEPHISSPARLTLNGKALDASAHRSGDFLILELEPAYGQRDSFRHARRLQSAFAEMRACTEFAELYRIAARSVADLTGFDRVMIYKFDPDWHGEVVGECLTAEIHSYFGHHFPASDIPEQARKLYSQSWLRIIPDATYSPVPLSPALNPRTGEPLDLSQAFLRSVSPVHLEYLRNMEVAASMSISLRVVGKLWGLIACHHRTPRALSFSVRAACELFGQVCSLEIGAKEEAKRLADRSQASCIQTRFFDSIAKEHNVREAMVKYMPELLEFMGASGAAIYMLDELKLLGKTPPEPEVRHLVDWLTLQPVDPVFATESIAGLFPSFSPHKATASGLLAVRLSNVEHHYVLWFRPEVRTTLTWAGAPGKIGQGDRSLHPRRSFAAWQETVSGHAIAWSESELQGAKELRNALNALLLRRNSRLIEQNAELEVQNTNLNSFAHIASHDLKEPLRGIGNYCRSLLEDYGAQLPQEGFHRLQTISNLADRAEQLLFALGRFTKLGRMVLSSKEVNLDKCLKEVLEGLQASLSAENVELKRQEPLPVVLCDEILIREVLSNLILNAIRYNLSEHKSVEIGCEPADNSFACIYVRDNGIGIREKHYHDIFTLFRRLHIEEDFGGGLGAGLAIVKSIVEKHGGRIWVESTPGKGSTFRFTLPKPSADTDH